MASGLSQSLASPNHQVAHPRLQITFDSRHTDYQAQLIAEQLEATQAFFMRAKLNHHWPQGVKLRIFASYDQFQQYQQQRWAQMISMSGFYDVQANLIAVLNDGDTQQLLMRVRHELVHALLATNYPNAPIWLHEGLAENLEGQLGQLTKPALDFEQWLDSMRRFSQEDQQSYRSAAAGTRFLLQQVPNYPQMLQRLASAQPLSSATTLKLKQQWAQVEQL